MPKVGLNKQIIIDTAIRLIEENGYENFSMRGLAKHLHIKTASLYNHVKGMGEIWTEVSIYAIEALNQAQFSAIAEKKGDAAMIALANAYRDYALEHPEIYKVVMSRYCPHNSEIEMAENAGDIPSITIPFMQVLSDYPLDPMQKMHWQRVLRSIIHGFLSQAEAGYFCHLPIDTNTSYQVAIRCFIDGLNAACQRAAEDQLASIS